MEPRAFDEARAASFLTRVIEDHAASMTVFLCALGDRLGLFAALAEAGPATSAELAEGAGVHERYAREWLAGLHAAGYVARDDGERYSLPREHHPTLLKEGHPFFQGHFHEQITGLYPMFEPVCAAFRSGDGVADEQYPDHFDRGLERATRIWVDRFLTTMWLPGLPDVHQRLTDGAGVADVGCGAGLATRKMAEAYPESRFVGYDVDTALIARATEAAAQAGLDERLTFETRDVTRGLPGPLELVTCFDVLHDVADPLAALRQMREALAPGGHLLLGEWAVEDDPDEEVNPLATLMYGFSVMYCVPTTRARGGEARGTLGLPEPEIQALAHTAGFAKVKTLFTGHPVLGLYLLSP